MNSNEKMVLITGATRGLGLAMVRLLAAQGHTLVLVARDRHGLEQVADRVAAEFGDRPRTLSVDLAADGAAEQVFEWTRSQGLRIDMLVNNAGIGINGAFREMSLQANRSMERINITAPTELLRLYLPGMVERGWGRVLNVASVVAFQPGGPGMAAYYGGKSYLLALSRGLKRELRGTGVTVTALCPGPMDTDFYTGDQGFAGIGLTRLPKMAVERVAARGVAGMLARRGVVIPGVLAKVLAFAGMLPPRSLALGVNRLLLKRV